MYYSYLTVKSVQYLLHFRRFTNLSNVLILMLLQRFYYTKEKVSVEDHLEEYGADPVTVSQQNWTFLAPAVFQQTRGITFA